MDLKHEFETETGQGIGYLEGKEDPEDNGTYNDAYVEWLQQKLIDRTTSLKDPIYLGDIAVIPEVYEAMIDYRNEHSTNQQRQLAVSCKVIKTILVNCVKD